MSQCYELQRCHIENGADVTFKLRVDRVRTTSLQVTKNEKQEAKLCVTNLPHHNNVLLAISM